MDGGGGEPIEVHQPFIAIVPLGMTPNDMLQQLEQTIAQNFNVRTQMTPPLELSFAFDSSRNQYNSTSILTRLLENPPEGVFKILGVTHVDLFIPILTFVFGEAQLNGLAAVVSMHRMRNELYGLPRDEKVLQSRLIKEAIHELGHTFGLYHCRDDACVMHASTYTEEIDLKSDSFCASCGEFITSVLSEPVWN
jgi:archaemetzincin